LRAVGEGDLAGQVAYRYDYVNYAHPFREGNGRSTREFFDLLLSERGSGLDWGKTDLEELHGACHVARANSDLTGLVAMFKGILDEKKKPIAIRSRSATSFIVSSLNIYNARVFTSSPARTSLASPPFICQVCHPRPR
ncbi:Fic family protein, partial [Klebsiella pneumoniae]|nr:Fic family protein [Klebsiella pneumoniae]